MVLDALEMARASRGGHRLIGLVMHSDAGSQFTSVRFTERLEEIGARPSIGTVADSYDSVDSALELLSGVCRCFLQRPEQGRCPGLLAGSETSRLHLDEEDEVIEDDEPVDPLLCPPARP